MRVEYPWEYGSDSDFLFFFFSELVWSQNLRQ